MSSQKYMFDNYSLGFIKKLYSLRNVGIIVVMTEFFFFNCFQLFSFRMCTVYWQPKKHVAYSRKQAL